MQHSGTTLHLLARPAGVALVGMLVSGCSGEPQQYRFSMEGESSGHDHWFFPVVEVNEELFLGQHKVKTVDAPGYHSWEVSAGNPRYLLNGWTTPSLKNYTRVGLIIFRGNESREPVMGDPRVFWFSRESINSTAPVTDVHIPAFESLETIELQPHWGKPKEVAQ